MIIMNRTSKVFLIIIILLVIVIGVLIYFYMKTLDNLVFTSDMLTKYVKAIEDYGLEAQVQDDGWFVLVKRETPVERVPAE